MAPWLCSWMLLLSVIVKLSATNEDAKRLFDDLMVRYNRHRRPSRSQHEPLTIDLKLRLSQIIDVHEIDQIMTCSVWLKQVWIDQKLSWDPKQYGGVNVLYVPYEMIWVPDIVLYNNAASYYNITISTKATLRYDGQVTWEPPAIFKSLCQIDVQWFPFDEQKCQLKFGSWTYPNNLLDIQLMDSEPRYELEKNQYGELLNVTVVEDGIGENFVLLCITIWANLSTYLSSFSSILYICQTTIHQWNGTSYPEWLNGVITLIQYHTAERYCLELRRKPLFYTVNVVFPCVGISFLTILVFYLPSNSGEKIALCISILVALPIFFLLLIELIPATSISLPLIGKYLLFIMIMGTLSVFVTVVSLNLHFRTPTTHIMPAWLKWLFLDFLPKILIMPRPSYLSVESYRRCGQRKMGSYDKVLINYHGHRAGYPKSGKEIAAKPNDRIQKIYNSKPVVKAFKNICVIADLLRQKDLDDKIDEDWKYIAMVLDRLFLIIFAFICILGAVVILLQAPTLYDTRHAIDIRYRPSNITLEAVNHDHL